MIKNLLFDLGGVIMNLDRMRAVRGLQALGMANADKVLGEYAQQGPFGALESGAITIDEFHRQMASLIDGKVDYDAIDRAFISFLDGIPSYRLDALKELRKDFGIYLLSNTNKLMWETEIKHQFRQQGLEIEDYFDGIVTSFEAKVMKPHAEIFNYAQEKLNIEPSETLFLDDSETNCEAARKLGWNAVCVTPGTEFTELIPPKRRSIVAVGMFDGVHAGHKFVLERLCELAETLKLEPVVVTFANHPCSVVRPDKTPLLITDVKSRIELIRKTGVERVEVLSFDESLRQLTAAEFVEKILKPRFGAEAVLIGYDNGFGSDKLNGADAYRSVLEPLGVTVYGCSPYAGFEVSSTMIRRALLEGDIEAANKMLGREFRISGKVVTGRKLGSTIGFPTANISVDKELILPKQGVYAAECCGLPTMVNIGTAPTVSKDAEAPVTVEAHIIGGEDDKMNLYGKTIDIYLLARIRDERRFENLDELKTALERDRKVVSGMVIR